jgi:hypothetical protein
LGQGKGEGEGGRSTIVGQAHVQLHQDQLTATTTTMHNGPTKAEHSERGDEGPSVGEMNNYGGTVIVTKLQATDLESRKRHQAQADATEAKEEQERKKLQEANARRIWMQLQAQKDLIPVEDIGGKNHQYF